MSLASWRYCNFLSFGRCSLGRSFVKASGCIRKWVSVKNIVFFLHLYAIMLSVIAIKDVIFTRLGWGMLENACTRVICIRHAWGAERIWDDGCSWLLVLLSKVHRFRPSLSLGCVTALQVFCLKEKMSNSMNPIYSVTYIDCHSRS